MPALGSPLRPADGGDPTRRPSRLASTWERVRAGILDRAPPALREARMAIGLRAALGLVVVAGLAVAVASLVAVRARPHRVVVPPVTVARPSAAAAVKPSPSPAAQLVVDVVGSVRRPGVVRLPAGARVLDAVAAAGGLKPGAAPGALNLAALLADGQQVVVGGSVVGAAPGAGGSPPTGGLLDLNAATLEQLDTLPGVGPVLAQRILDWRLAHGRFTSVEQLAEVGGIGERKLADIRAKVRA